jgi:hypothetical protein
MVRKERVVRKWRLTYVLDNHDQEGEFDAQGLLGVEGRVDVVGGDVGAHDLEDRRLNIGVGYSFDVAVADLFVPDLEGLGSKQRETGLACGNEKRPGSGPVVCSVAIK